ncbi:MAG: S41 family peptidase, partial [Clostridiales bacterium]
MQKIDRWFAYYPQEQVSAAANYFQGATPGVGVVVEAQNGSIVITKVIADTIAATAGFQAGDRIVSVDGQMVSGFTAEAVAELLQGEYNSLVTLTVERNGVSQVSVLNRKLVPLPTVQYQMEKGGRAYLRITRFSAYTGSQTAEALAELTKAGMNCLLLDLRDCPGGVMDAAVAVLGQLVVNGPVTFVVEKNGYNGFYATAPDSKPLTIPLAVLVNEKTASAAEMLAAVVQDNHRGAVIGMPTYGKGLIQSLVKLPTGSGLYFTVGKYVTRGMQDIATAGGVIPDILVAKGELSQKIAAEWLARQSEAAKTMTFTLGSRTGQQDGKALSLKGAPLMKGDASYVPIWDLLAGFGWELNYYQGKWYGFDGSRRLVIDTTAKTLYYGGQTGDLLEQGGALYLPVSWCRNFGYGVDWQPTVLQITISRK